jgi:arylsulfatase A-like enzyme
MSQPNILLIVLDSVRKDHLSAYGYDRPTTPRLEEFSGRATRYEEAIAAAPWTPPSHGALFSGKYPSNVGVLGRTPDYDESQPHVADRLSEAGYTTFGFSNSHHTGPDRGFDRGFDFYHDILSLPRFMGKMYEPSLDYVRHLYDYFVNDYDDSAFQLRRLRTQIDRSEDPFFGFINCNSAHSPYNPPEEFTSEFESYFDDWDAVDRESARAVGDRDGYEYMMDELEMTETEWDLVKCWYDGEIRYLDYLLGNFFEFLRARDCFENTMIVVTSDHGEHFGEHGLAYHQFSLSEILINVPLVVKWPDQETAEVSEELVSLVDFMPTAIDVATGSPPSDADGRSLRSADPPETVFAEYGRPPEPLQEKLDPYRETFDQYDRGLQAARTDEHKLVCEVPGEETLYRIDDGQETEIDDEELAAELGDRIDRRLGSLPTGTYDEDLADHVTDHLEEMGYM